MFKTISRLLLIHHDAQYQLGMMKQYIFHFINSERHFTSFVSYKFLPIYQGLYVSAYHAFGHFYYGKTPLFHVPVVANT